MSRTRSARLSVGLLVFALAGCAGASGPVTSEYLRRAPAWPGPSTGDRIVVAPLGFPAADIPNIPPQARRSLQRELAAALRDRGLTASTDDRLTATYQRVAAELGGLFDPMSGEPLAGRQQRVVQTTLERLGADVLLVPRCVWIPAEFHGSWVEFADARQGIAGLRGGDYSLRGGSQAILLQVSVRRGDGGLVFVNGAGWVYPYRYERVPGRGGILTWDDLVFEDKVRRLDTVERALAPLFEPPSRSAPSELVLRSST